MRKYSFVKAQFPFCLTYNPDTAKNPCVMTNSEFMLLIGNRTSNLYVTLERLLQNNNPRGLFNEYEDSVFEIAQLQQLESSPGFLSFYSTEIKRQADSLKNTDVYPVASKIAEFSSPALLKQWVDKLFVKNLFSYLNDEKSYIVEMMAGKSRKKTKADYLNKIKERMLVARHLVQESVRGDPLENKIREFEIFLNETIAQSTA